MYISPELHSRVLKERHRDLLHDAEMHRLLHQGKPRQPKWLASQGCRILCQLGRWLVRLGQQLQSAGVYRQDMLTS
jgi:hypothetical protein